MCPGKAPRALPSVDEVALAILGGEPGDADEMNDARGYAHDVLELFAGDPPTVTPIGNLNDLVERSGYRPRPTLLAHVVPSVNRPGELSFRLRLTDRSWTGFLEALAAEGFEPGDVVRIEAIR
jgi:hypothetical protein